jgi:hypothetical protein
MGGLNGVETLDDLSNALSLNNSEKKGLTDNFGLT